MKRHFDYEQGVFVYYRDGVYKGIYQTIDKWEEDSPHNVYLPRLDREIALPDHAVFENLGKLKNQWPNSTNYF
jgi:hypothetical protein